MRKMKGAELKRRRLKAGLSQNKLAMQCGCSQAHISRLERGDREIPKRIMTAVDGDILAVPKMKGIPSIPFKDEQQRKELRKIWIRDFAPRREKEND